MIYMLTLYSRMTQVLTPLSRPEMLEIAVRGAQLDHVSSLGSMPALRSLRLRKFRRFHTGWRGDPAATLPDELVHLTCGRQQAEHV